MIKVQNLFYDYEGKGKYAVNDVSFEISKGQIFGFLGPSGAGKSTVQNLMTTLLPLQKGEILYNGISIRKLNKNFFNRIGYSFEHPNIYSKLTGYENLKYYAGLFKVPTVSPEKLLKAVKLESSINKRAGYYSKGMKQRLVFARSIINNPEILFLDEPVSGLDPAIASVIKDIIKKKQKEGTTIFLTTHNMHIAEELCDIVAFLNEGKIVTMDSPRNLKLKYGKNSVKIDYIENQNTKSIVLFQDNEEDRQKLHTLIDTGNIQTIHSQEATLEQIFISLTGKEIR